LVWFGFGQSVYCTPVVDKCHDFDHVNNIGIQLDLFRAIELPLRQ